MNWYSIFYWMTVSDRVKNFFNTTSDIFTVITVIVFILLCITSYGRAVAISEEKVASTEAEKTNPVIRGWELVKKYSWRLFFIFLPLSLITWAGYVFTPTKKDCMLIVAGGAVGNFLTTDTSAKQLPSDITRFLHLSLKKEVEELGEEAKKELGMQTAKEKLIDKIKTLSKEELVEYLKNDSTIIK